MHEYKERIEDRCIRSRAVKTVEVTVMDPASFDTVNGIPVHVRFSQDKGEGVVTPFGKVVCLRVRLNDAVKNFPRFASLLRTFLNGKIR